MLTQQVFKFSHDPEFGIIFLWFSSGTAFTFGSQKIQSKFSINTGMTSELAHKYIMYTLTIILQLADHALLGQPDITIPSSSSQLLVPAGSNIEEIRLKQVSTFPLADFTTFPISIGHLNFIFSSGTRIPRQQSVLLSNWSNFSGRRRSNIGRFNRAIGWNQGQTPRIPPVSESRHWSTDQECTADSNHLRTIGG